MTRPVRREDDVYDGERDESKDDDGDGDDDGDDRVDPTRRRLWADARWNSPVSLTGSTAKIFRRSPRDATTTRPRNPAGASNPTPRRAPSRPPAPTSCSATISSCSATTSSKSPRRRRGPRQDSPPPGRAPRRVRLSRARSFPRVSVFRHATASAAMPAASVERHLHPKPRRRRCRLPPQLLRAGDHASAPTGVVTTESVLPRVHDFPLYPGAESKRRGGARAHPPWRPARLGRSLPRRNPVWVGGAV